MNDEAWLHACNLFKDENIPLIILHSYYIYSFRGRMMNFIFHFINQINYDVGLYKVSEK